jgi:hypothetical protein
VRSRAQGRLNLFNLSEPSWNSALVLKVGLTECRFQGPFLTRHKNERHNGRQDQKSDQDGQAPEQNSPAKP